jgi:anoctamin-10
LQIGASIERLLKGAEEICLKKMHKQKSFRDFVIKDLENFEGSSKCPLQIQKALNLFLMHAFFSKDDLENFLSQSERLKIIDYELSNLKYLYDEIAFENNVKLEPKDSIINQLREQNLIVNVFPLHDKDELKKLEFVWYKSVSSYLPFNLIPLSKQFRYFRFLTC